MCEEKEPFYHWILANIFFYYMDAIYKHNEYIITNMYLYILNYFNKIRKEDKSYVHWKGGNKSVFADIIYFYM